MISGSFDRIYIMEEGGDDIGSATHPGGLAVVDSRGAGAGACINWMIGTEEGTARATRNCSPKRLHFPPDSGNL